MGAGVTLAGATDTRAATRWALVTGPVLVAQFALLVANLDENREAEKTALRPRLGVANLASLARGTLVAWLAGLAVVPSAPGPLAWAPAALYGGSVALDYLDGSLARRVGHVSALGARLDAEFDGLAILVGLGVAVATDVLPDVLLLVGLVKYAYVAAEWAVRRRSGRLRALPYRHSRRLLAAAQMVVVAVVLVPFVAPPGSALLAGGVGAAYALGFLRDWRLRTG